MHFSESLSVFLFLFVMGGGHPPSEGHFSTAAPNESSQGERAAEQESKHKLIYISLCVGCLANCALRGERIGQ
jgi:hypothetical protein